MFDNKNLYFDSSDDRLEMIIALFLTVVNVMYGASQKDK